MDIERLEQDLRRYEKAYTEGNPLVSDEEYDKLKEFVERKRGQKIERVGAPVGKKEKYQLPVYMGSLDKIKPNSSELKNFLSKFPGPYCISEKVDGISLLYENNRGKYRCFVRGDGIEGADVSWILDILPKSTIPQHKGKAFYVRGELVLQRHIWEKLITEPEILKKKNPRNWVSGIVNRKENDLTPVLRKYVKQLSFVAYEYFDMKDLKAYIPQNKQLQILEDMEFEVVHYVVKSSLTSSTLEKLLTEWRESSFYNIDGIVVTDCSSTYERISGQNPKYAKAFKMDREDVLTTILEIEWNPNIFGNLYPRIRVDPVEIDGNTYQYATGNNAKFLMDMKLHIGAVIGLILGGEIIPKIVHVYETENFDPLPPKDYRGGWHWDKNQTHIVLNNPERDLEVQKKRIEHFFKILEIDFFKEGTIKKCIESGYNTIPKILKMKKSDFMKLPSIGDTMAEKLVIALEKYKTTPLSTVLAATPFMQNVGTKRFTALLDAIPDFMELTNKQLKSKIVTVPGFAAIMADTIVDNLDETKRFLATLPPREEVIFEQTSEPLDQTLEGQIVVFTGFRDADLKREIESPRRFSSRRF